jgi:cyclophilin family peptidyl-prolyl cis-trans isomerase
MRLKAALLSWLLAVATSPVSGFAQVLVKVDTSAGSFTLRLDAERAPLTVANFLAYARAGHYEGTVFHRVVSGFVIQGGGYTEQLTLKPTQAPVSNEAGNGLINRRGTVAMARTSAPHSADAQFFINLADNPDLDPKPTRWGYAVFGEVVEGLEVIDNIGHAPTTSRGDLQDVPVSTVVIRRLTITGAPQAR